MVPVPCNERRMAVHLGGECFRLLIMTYDICKQFKVYTFIRWFFEYHWHTFTLLHMPHDCECECQLCKYVDWKIWEFLSLFSINDKWTSVPLEWFSIIFRLFHFFSVFLLFTTTKVKLSQVSAGTKKKKRIR